MAWCEASWPVDWNGREDGPILLAVVMVYLGERPWGLVGEVLESVFESW